MPRHKNWKLSAARIEDHRKRSMKDEGVKRSQSEDTDTSFAFKGLAQRGTSLEEISQSGAPQNLSVCKGFTQRGASLKEISQSGAPQNLSVCKGFTQRGASLKEISQSGAPQNLSVCKGFTQRGASLKEISQSGAPSKSMINEFAKSSQLQNSSITSTPVFHQNQHLKMPNLAHDTNQNDVEFLKSIPSHKSPVNEPSFHIVQNIVYGNISQSDQQFSSETRDRQCTCNSLVFILKTKFTEILNFSPEWISNILVEGDQLYSQVIYELKCAGSFHSYLLQLEELPNVVSLQSGQFNITKEIIVLGTLKLEHSSPFVKDLESAMKVVLETFEMALIMIGGRCFAVMRYGKSFLFFDPHSHKNATEGIGKAILAFFKCVNDLISYMLSFFLSLGMPCSSMFEIQPLTVSQSGKTPSSVGHAKTAGNHQALLEKYFSTQNELARKFTESGKAQSQKSKNENVSRTEYHREYKRRQRMTPDIRERERKCEVKSKRKARTDPVRKTAEALHKTKLRMNPDICEKVKKIEVKSKRKARTDLVRKTAEALHKTKLRMNPDIREKERKCEVKSKQKARSDVVRKTAEALHKTKLRMNPDIREKERKCEVKSKQKARSDVVRKTAEALHKTKLRMNPDIREKVKKIEVKSKQKARSDVVKKTAEALHKTKLRMNPDIREKERKCEVKSKQKARSDVVRKTAEALHKTKLRMNPDIREKVKKIEVKSKQKARSDVVRKTAEALHKTKLRMNPDIREKERKCEVKSKQKARSDVVRKTAEALHKTKLRMNPDIREKERKCEVKSKQKARSDQVRKTAEALNKAKLRMKPDIREKERKSELKSKQKTRNIPHKKAVEDRRNLKSKQKARENVVFKEKERLAKQNRRRNVEFPKTSEVTRVSNEQQINPSQNNAQKVNMDIITQRFNTELSEGPVYVCSVCHQTWFRHSVTVVSEIMKNGPMKMCLTGVKSVDDREWICKTCDMALKNKKIPSISVRNKVCFPPKPQELDLYQLEERLVALRIPFMQMRELPRGGQFSIHGNVVNVPVDIQPTIKVLPHTLEKTTIPVKLKRKLVYKRAEISENIRPQKVLSALQWLFDHSSLYQDSGVQFDHQWISNIQNSDDVGRNSVDNSSENNHFDEQENSQNYNETHETETVVDNK